MVGAASAHRGGVPEALRRGVGGVDRLGPPPRAITPAAGYRHRGAGSRRPHRVQVQQAQRLRGPEGHQPRLAACAVEDSGCLEHLGQAGGDIQRGVQDGALLLTWWG